MDILTKEERSDRMGRVRSKRNRSTERRVRSLLMRERIRGWNMNVDSIVGAPDFLFPARKVAVFIDGCFWHGCPKCARPMPRSHRTYWAPKLQANITRAQRVNRQLRRLGFKVVRIWEHELSSPQPLQKLFRYLDAYR